MNRRVAVTITGLSWGDEGKGAVADFLSRKNSATLVIRHNGGAQAAHRVVLPDGREHVFSQWGSGTFAGARTFLSHHMVTHPIAMLNEARHLQAMGIPNPYDMVTVSPRARVATPYHQEMNRIREIVRDLTAGPSGGRHGSCGMGIGEAVVDAHKGYALTWADLTNYALTRTKLRMIRDEKMTEAADMGIDPALTVSRLRAIDFDRAVELMQLTARVIVAERDEERILSKHQSVIFEGAQGVLLDQDFGTQPYTTWSHCTDTNAMQMLVGTDFEPTRIGVVRAYATRHGPGPFPTFDQALTDALPDPTNGFNEWQRDFRCGWFDALLTKYAIECNGGIDALAVTNLDRWAQDNVRALRDPRTLAQNHVDDIAYATGAKVGITSHGPTWQDKRLPADAMITLTS